ERDDGVDDRRQDVVLDPLDRDDPLCAAVVNYGHRETSKPSWATARHRQTTYCPPLAVSVEPVMKLASSEARNRTQRAISSGSPSRPSGICGRMFFSSCSLGTALTISVAI